MHDETVIEILKNNVFPTLGCTDPVVVAYAAALARSVINGPIKKATITVDKNIYKNARRVTIPKTNLQGLDYACALGLLGGKHLYQLQVLQDISGEDIARAISMVGSHLVSTEVRKQTGLFVEIALETTGETSRCRIEGSYTNVTLLEANNQPSIDQKAQEPENISKPELGELTIDRIFGFVDNCPIEKIAFLEEGLEMNLKIAEAGLQKKDNSYFGQGLKKISGDCTCGSNTIMYAKMLTAAAADMRMDGADLPVMATAGSGNQGITGLIPLVAVAKLRQIERKKTIRAAALSHLVTIYIKKRIGILSQICGCSVAAGSGASAGITYLLDGNQNAAEHAITNTIGGLAGIICDGAKKGCAFKLSISAGIAVEAALLALEDVFIKAHDGIIAESLEQTIENLAYISRVGMRDVDDTILNVMRNMCE